MLGCIFEDEVAAGVGVAVNAEMAAGVVDAVAKSMGRTINVSDVCDMGKLKEKQYDMLAETLRDNLDIKAIYGMMGIKHDKG